MIRSWTRPFASNTGAAASATTAAATRTRGRIAQTAAITRIMRATLGEA